MCKILIIEKDQVNFDSDIIAIDYNPSRMIFSRINHENNWKRSSDKI